jgi:hypothetical protein
MLFELFCGDKSFLLVVLELMRAFEDDLDLLHEPNDNKKNKVVNNKRIEIII